MLASSATVTVVQHLAFEDLGSFEPVLRQRGHAIDVLQAGVDDVSSAIHQAECLVVLGGPIGVYETEAYPFVVDEVEALRERLRARRPTLGICLGAQLMAAALGARVYPGGRKEIGWGPLRLTQAGQASPLAALEGVPVLHWHGDTFDLPNGCELLASTDVYERQAFSLGPNVLGLQCHPEADARRFERWLIGHAGELASAGIDVRALREQAQALGPGLERASNAVLRDWLAGLTP
ncbi:MAG: glutamine amidotransferase [Gammaproteobacteria bacterium]|nr:glutamine amidotransferase [Gammaproteobacteria bacterium]